MASLYSDKSGNRRLQFKTPGGKRVILYLGDLPLRQAQTVKSYIERLIIAAVSGDNIDTDTAAWLTRINDELHGKLVKAGLIVPRRVVGSDALGPFLDAYIAKRVDVKGLTAIVYGHTRRCLVDFFGAARPMDQITAGDCEDFRRWLAAEQKLADNTVRRRCGIAKQFFRDAIRRKLIAENPFADMAACSIRENRERDHFVGMAEAQAVLGACPDAQWRLIFALSRYGGLRCPSEHLGLRLADVDWEHSRFTVRSPKTERHVGKESRLVPIFPELRPYLNEVWDAAEPGTEHLITRYRDKGQNLRTQLERIIRKAGLKPWPKLFQNLRASRATELVSAGWPEFKVCSWLGHTEAIAKKHYWQVTDADFEKAAEMPDGAQLKTRRPAHVSDGRASPRKTQTPDFAGVCKGVLSVTTPKVGGTGLEPATSTV